MARQGCIAFRLCRIPATDVKCNPETVGGRERHPLAKVLVIRCNAMRAASPQTFPARCFWAVPPCGGGWILFQRCAIIPAGIQGVPLKKTGKEIEI